MANTLRILGVTTWLAGGALWLAGARFGLAVLLVGVALLFAAKVSSGPLYGEPPDPTRAPLCPICGERMRFVQYHPDAEEYRCAEHGAYIRDSQGLLPGHELDLDQA